MSVTQAKSTYNALIDDILFDLNEGAKASEISPEAIQHYILRACEDICKKIDVEEEWELALVESQSDYQIQDRPAITAVAGTTTVTVTATDHDLASTEEIYVAGVTGLEGANGTSYVTVTTANQFTLDGAVGTGTYISGGKFWKTSEIPTYFKRFRFGSRSVNGQIYGIEPESMSTILNLQTQYATTGYTAFTCPAKMAIGRSEGKRYLRFWPTPVDAEDITLYGVLSIVPSEYHGDALTTTIPLSSEYDDLIKSFCLWRLYRFLKNYELAKDAEGEYTASWQEFRRRTAGVIKRTINYS
jgi:hypothetical protein